jgi:hypothetical protein
VDSGLITKGLKSSLRRWGIILGNDQPLTRRMAESDLCRKALNKSSTGSREMNPC